MYIKTIFTSFILILLFTKSKICGKIQPSHEQNKLEVTFNEGQLKVQIFVPVSPEEKSDYENIEQMSPEDRSALQYKYYDDFQFKKSGNTSIQCDQLPEKIQIMIGKVNKRLSKLEIDNFDDESRLEEDPNTYEFKFNQMNLRRHKINFTANCVETNLYVFIILGVNQMKCKQDQSAIIYVNNYVHNHIRYLQLLRFAYPFDGTPYEEIYHQPLSLVSEEQNIRNLYFSQYDVNGKDIMDVNVQIDSEELDIAIPGFMFAHMYSNIDIMVSLQNDTIKIYALEIDDQQIQDFVYLRFYLKIDFNLNLIEGDIFDLTNQQNIAVCQQELQPIQSSNYSIEYRFQAGMFGQSSHSLFEAQPLADEIYDKQIIIVQNTWKNPNLEELKLCHIKQKSGQNGNDISLNWQMYEVKKKNKLKEKKLVTFVDNFQTQDQLTVAQQVKKRNKSLIDLNTLQSDNIQKKAQDSIDHMKRLTDQQKQQIQDNLKSLLQDLQSDLVKNKRQTKSPANIKSKKSQEVINAPTQDRMSLNDTIRKQLINNNSNQNTQTIKKPIQIERTSRNFQNTQGTHADDQEDNKAQILSNVNDNFVQIKQAPFQNFEITKKLSLTKNDQFHKNNYDMSFIRLQRQQQQNPTLVQFQLTQQQGIFNCQIQPNLVSQIELIFNNAKELKIFHNNQEMINVLHLFKISGNDNLIIRTSDSFKMIKSQIQSSAETYFCEFSQNKNNQIMLNLAEKRFKFQFHSKVQKFNNNINVEMTFINLNNGHRITNHCNQKLPEQSFSSLLHNFINLKNKIHLVDVVEQNIHIQSFIANNFTFQFSQIQLQSDILYATKGFSCSITYIQETKQISINEYFFDKNNSFVYVQNVFKNSKMIIYRFDYNPLQDIQVKQQRQGLVFKDQLQQIYLIAYQKDFSSFLTFSQDDFNVLFNTLSYQYKSTLPQFVQLLLEPGVLFLGLSCQPENLQLLKITKGYDKKKLVFETKSLVAAKDSLKQIVTIDNYNNEQFKSIYLIDNRANALAQGQIGFHNIVYQNEYKLTMQILVPTFKILKITTTQFMLH